MLAVASRAGAQPGFVSLPFTVDGVERTAALWIPAGYDRTQRWPLVVYLHGNGIQGDNRGRVGSEWLDSLFVARALMRQPDAFPALVLIPRCPEGATWVTRTVGPDTPEWRRLRPPREDAIGHIDAAVDEVLNRFPVDLDRITLSGFSMGGHGSLRYAEMRSNRFRRGRGAGRGRHDRRSPVAGRHRTPAVGVSGGGRPGGAGRACAADDRDNFVRPVATRATPSTPTSAIRSWSAPTPSRSSSTGSCRSVARPARSSSVTAPSCAEIPSGCRSETES